MYSIEVPTFFANTFRASGVIERTNLSSCGYSTCPDSRVVFTRARGRRGGAAWTSPLDFLLLRDRRARGIGLVLLGRDCRIRIDATLTNLKYAILRPLDSRRQEVSRSAPVQVHAMRTP